MKISNYKFILSLILLLTFQACRFIVPTNKDSVALNERGAFGNGAPSWAQLPKDQKVNLPDNSGIIPQTFTVPEAAAFTAQANASSAVSANIGRGVELELRAPNGLSTEAKEEYLAKNTNKQEQVNEQSELGQIEKLCPGTETAVVDAIKTENVGTRIRKYLTLTKRCPSSANIWVWLAKDYQGLARYQDAKRCAQAALSIDSKNIEAQSILREINQNDY